MVTSELGKLCRRMVEVDDRLAPSIRLTNAFDSDIGIVASMQGLIKSWILDESYGSLQTAPPCPGFRRRLRKTIRGVTWLLVYIKRVLMQRIKYRILKSI